MMTAIAHSHEVSIKISQDILLKGILSIPKEATKIIVFAHGSGSGRYARAINMWLMYCLKMG